jgi:hypothetical protein
MFKIASRALDTLLDLATSLNIATINPIPVSDTCVTISIV